LNKPILIYEESSKIGSLGSTLISYANDYGYNKKIYHMAIKDEFIQHGDVNSLLKECQLAYEDVLALIKEIKNDKIRCKVM